MANPQAENGHVDLANDIVEALARVNLSGREMRCLWVIFRKTYGWHKKSDLIALSQFSLMTGLSRQVVCKILKLLLSKKIIAVDKNDNSQINSYRFNKDFDKWTQLPKKITLLSKKTMTVVEKDNQVLSKRRHTKENSTKETIQKKVVHVENFISDLKTNPAYSHINLENELHKMDAWLLLPKNKHRKKTLSFILNWINKIEKPLEAQNGKPPTDIVKRRLWELEQRTKDINSGTP